MIVFSFPVNTFFIIWFVLLYIVQQSNNSNHVEQREPIDVSLIFYGTMFRIAWLIVTRCWVSFEGESTMSTYIGSIVTSVIISALLEQCRYYANIFPWLWAAWKTAIFQTAENRGEVGEETNPQEQINDFSPTRWKIFGNIASEEARAFFAANNNAVNNRPPFPRMGSI